MQNINIDLSTCCVSVGWIKPITEEHFHDFAELPSGCVKVTNLRGYVAQEVD